MVWEVKAFCHSEGAIATEESSLPRFAGRASFYLSAKVIVAECAAFRPGSFPPLLHGGQALTLRMTALDMLSALRQKCCVVFLTILCLIIKRLALAACQTLRKGIFKICSAGL